MTTYLESRELLCFSHLRWDFVFQRQQHLMSRFAKRRRVFFIEEPLFESDNKEHLRHTVCRRTGVHVVTPVLTPEHRPQPTELVKQLLGDFLKTERVLNPIVWFYSPMWLDSFPQDVMASVIVYDCMDELSMFKGAPVRLHLNEAQLLKMTDLVFTGGISLFEYKRSLHPQVHPFPSGVDITHFAQARATCTEREEQSAIPHPRLGFAGVIDERMDLELIGEVARRRPSWHLVMIGPVVKIDTASLPRAHNLHWLGMQDYQALPSFFAGWDVAIMPFAINDATRFISPTKTPEFLSAGLPVVSTPVRDVVRPYGELGLARIANTAEEFVEAAEQAMAFKMGMKWRERADAFLETMSWDSVWASMNNLVEQLLASRQAQFDAGIASTQGEVARV
jgi:UDP-galactopyranose mutase